MSLSLSIEFKIYVTEDRFGIHGLISIFMEVIHRPSLQRVRFDILGKPWAMGQSIFAMLASVAICLSLQAGLALCPELLNNA